MRQHFMQRASARVIQQLFFSGLLIALVILWPVFATAQGAGGEEGLKAVQAPDGAGLIERVQDWIAASYERAPALVLGLGLLVAVPPLALIGLIVRSRDRSLLEVTQFKTRARARDEKPLGREGVRTGFVPVRSFEAWLEIERAGAPAERFSLSRPLVRIGRETDNDICFTDMTVHRYHAAVHRTEDAEFVITDLSSAGGNGVTVNGRPVTEARLADGDSIELGRAKLKFTARTA